MNLCVNFISMKIQSITVEQFNWLDFGWKKNSCKKSSFGFFFFCFEELIMNDIQQHNESFNWNKFHLCQIAIFCDIYKFKDFEPQAMPTFVSFFLRIFFFVFFLSFSRIVQQCNVTENLSSEKAKNKAKIFKIEQKKKEKNQI